MALINTADAVYLGDQPADRIYKGADRVWPAWTPADLFANGEQGALYYFTGDFAGLYQDAAGTTPVTAVGQPVGLMLDKSGNGNHASQATTTARPELRQDGDGNLYLEFDGVDDHFLFGPVLAADGITVGATITMQSTPTGTVGIIGGVVGTTGLLRAANQARMYPAPAAGSGGPNINGRTVAVIGANSASGNYVRVDPDGYRDTSESTVTGWSAGIIGSYGAMHLFAGMHMSRAFAIDRILSDDERDLLMRWLMEGVE